MTWRDIVGQGRDSLLLSLLLLRPLAAFPLGSLETCPVRFFLRRAVLALLPPSDPAILDEPGICERIHDSGCGSILEVAEEVDVFRVKVPQTSPVIAL